MAKISANGDSALRAWKGPEGERLVLTRKGRVLRNWLKGDGLSLIHSAGAQVDVVERYAERLEFKEVKV